ncbi:hypothetical protein yinte0001_27660 [Yersinia intermedia ATCC 29909]|nr:hypothetical protein yinte0001_27660 [Yersinia intermedia ATCC 29909]
MRKSLKIIKSQAVFNNYLEYFRYETIFKNHDNIYKWKYNFTSGLSLTNNKIKTIF